MYQNSNDSSLGQTHVIFLDKNHPPNALDRTVNDIIDNVPPGVISKKIYLVPEVN